MNNLKFLAVIFILIGVCQGMATENLIWISPDTVEIDGQQMILDGVSCSGLSEGMKEFVTLIWAWETDGERIEYEIIGNTSSVVLWDEDLNINKKVMEHVLFYQ